MSAPRRPDKPGGRPAPSRSKPGARSAGPRRGEKDAPKGPREDRPEKPVKGPRVRKDGSVASGRAEDRRDRAEGAPAGRREARPARDARPGSRTEHRSDRAEGASTGRREGRPSRDGKPARTRSDSGARPARDGQPASRTRSEGRAPAGRAEDRRVRRDGALVARREERPARDASSRPARTTSSRSATAKPSGSAPRVRKDGSLAVRTAPGEAHGRREPQRIAKLLARAGVASRREIERMIEEGRIALNGAVLETPATILTSLAGVTVDGQPVAAPEAPRLFLFHKPSGVLTAERDFSGRPTIYDRLPRDLPRLVPVGRLDLNTEGLLLLTNDGELKRKLELPSTGIPRVYRARAYGEVSQEDLEALSEGVEIEGVRYGSIDANMERRTGRNLWIEMKLTEGKNREVRRVLEYLGLQVSRLIRTAYGSFILADLPSGEVGEVKQHELVEFRKTLK